MLTMTGDAPVGSGRPGSPADGLAFVTDGNGSNIAGVRYLPICAVIGPAKSADDDTY
jgi:hypothetical protein